MVARVLALAETWTAWDGQPRPEDDRIYTPYKAIRRVADHLAQIEAQLAGMPPIPDAWHPSRRGAGSRGWRRCSTCG